MLPSHHAITSCKYMYPAHQICVSHVTLGQLIISNGNHFLCQNLQDKDSILHPTTDNHHHPYVIMCTKTCTCEVIHVLHYTTISQEYYFTLGTTI